MLSLALLFLLLLTGCGKGSAPPDAVAIVRALMAAAALSTARSKAGRAARHYLDRRVLYLTSKNGSWATETGYTSLTTRLAAEMQQVGDFVDERTTTLTGTDPVSPAHRDLEDAAKHLTTDGPSAISTQLQKNRDQRKERIGQIAWRACAIEAKVWSGGDSTLAPTLQKPPVIEILDRRLHAVEMLILHDEGDLGKWSVASATSGWKDQQRTSMFQYPWVRHPDSADFEGALGAAGLTIAGLAPDWKDNPGEIDFKLQVRLRPAAAGDWSWDDSDYVLTLTAQGSTAMDHIIPLDAKVDPAFEDFFERNWMFCDIMLAALHMQGFRFSRLRKTGSDSDFNTAMAGGVTLRPVITDFGPPSVTTLMANGAPWFDAVAIPHDELQVGDHLIFWNNQFVRFILFSAFGLENSFVTRIGADGYQVMLAGHGMTETNEKNFAETMAKEMQRTYDGLRAFIDSKVAGGTPPPVLGVKVSGRPGYLLVNWAPFDETFGPADSTVKLKTEGAWWFRLLRQQLSDHPSDPTKTPSMAESLAMIPKSVRVDTSIGMTPPTLPSGSFTPDYQESIYLPLSLPAGVSGGWDKYFASHKGSGDVVDVVDLIPDGSMIPGFFLKGQTQKSLVPVLRPKVQT